MGRAGSPRLAAQQWPKQAQARELLASGPVSAQFLDHKSRNGQVEEAVSDAVQGHAPLIGAAAGRGTACGRVGVSIPTIRRLEAQSGDLGGRDYTAGKIISAL